MGALSDLFLDTELQPEDHQRIARVLAASGYSEAELEQILRSEVGPVLLPNLLSIAGNWAGFDLGWLEAEILRGERAGGSAGYPGPSRQRWSVTIGRAFACSCGSG